MAVVASVGLVPIVLSGVASASALRLSNGSGAGSWRNGSGALGSVGAGRLPCAVEDEGVSVFGSFVPVSLLVCLVVCDR